MSEEQIEQMVNKFLSWQLPDDFMPDGGISYKKPYDGFQPIGTNLFTATQARQMIRYITEEISHV
jgi:hypothetical protein